MAIQQTKKQSDLEKRLQILRRQVYEKERIVQSASQINSDKIEYNVQSTKTKNYEPRTMNSHTDLTYLYKDLTKILVLSTLAIGGQIVLFFLLQNHVFKI